MRTILLAAAAVMILPLSVPGDSGDDSVTILFTSDARGWVKPAG